MNRILLDRMHIYCTIDERDIRHRDDPALNPIEGLIGLITKPTKRSLWGSAREAPEASGREIQPESWALFRC